MARAPNAPFDLAEVVIGLHRGGDARPVPQSGGPPTRIEGYTIGAPHMTRPAPHAGEMHPDGDELLFLVSGRATLEVEEDGAWRAIELRAGQAFVVPRGVWHRLRPEEPSQLVHVTPGPRGEHRPLAKP